MDSFDIKLLTLIQENNRLTSEQLSKIVGLSPTACQRRLKRYREKGIIASEIAVLSPKAVGRYMTLIVQVSMEREQPDFLNAFKTAMKEAPEVMQCYYVTGSADFIIVLTTKDMEDYDDFTQRHFQSPNIRSFNTSVVMDRVKVGLSLPVETKDSQKSDQDNEENL